MAKKRQILVIGHNTNGCLPEHEKIAYEVIKLLSAMEHDPRYIHAWIAMGGTGWSESILGFVSTGEIQKWIPAMVGKVTIFLDPNDLMQRASKEIVL